MNAPEVSVIVPAYNEEEGMRELLESVVREFDDDRFEVIVVNDGSTDRTAEIASGFPVRLISHKRNRGYGAALKTGIRNARGQIVAFMDSDAQHRPQFLHAIMDKLQGEDHDMVIGARTGGRQSTLIRTPGKVLIRKLAEFLVKDKVPDINSGMRALRRDEAVRFLPLCPDGFSMTTTLTLSFMCEHKSVGYVAIAVGARKGSSTVGWRDGLRTLFNICALLVLFYPRRVFVPISVALFVLGTGFAVYGVLEVGRVPNTSTVLITTSVLIFCFSFLAEQIAMLRRLVASFASSDDKGISKDKE